MAQNSPSGRFTPKGGINAAKVAAKDAAKKAVDGAQANAGDKAPGYAATGRYTPPKPTASAIATEVCV